MKDIILAVLPVFLTWYLGNTRLRRKHGHNLSAFLNSKKGKYHIRNLMFSVYLLCCVLAFCLSSLLNIQGVNTYVSFLLGLGVIIAGHFPYRSCQTDYERA
ncbi:hypothetical protein [Olivibacter sp. XZL3]|uniref:hypothetical protein n=1 Tax=Olivibacter sp. XZL3 TaxID=1735116 RepID=UPI001064EAF3|nr:hypothetical protein [Olivibacter sp. XZL3]